MPWRAGSASSPMWNCRCCSVAPIANGCVCVDGRQQTSVPGVSLRSVELTGIGGLDKALLEGGIAGATRTCAHVCIDSKTKRCGSFVALLDETFALRDECTPFG